MINKKYESILKEPYEVRNRWAFSLTFIFSLIIFVSFAFYKGYIGLPFDQKEVKENSVVVDIQRTNTANLIDAPSPLQNTKNIVGGAYGEISTKLNEVKDTIYSVFVPFFTGIDVYEKK